MLLPPRRAHTQRLLLNQWFVVDHAGRYHVSARRTLRYSTRAAIIIENTSALWAPSSITFSSEFDVTIVPGEKGAVEKAFEPFLKNLNGRDLRLHSIILGFFRGAQRNADPSLRSGLHVILS